MNTTITVEVTKRTRVGFRRKTQYSFKVSSAGNYQILAAGTESYANIADAAHAASLVTGFDIRPALGKQTFPRTVEGEVI